MSLPKELKKVNDTLWELPIEYKPGMHVPARIYASEKLIGDMDAGVFDQIANVATLNGIQRYAYCMPDGHWGYGFPIGGAAAMDPETGVISPGGIGFDVNCGMRLIRTNLTYDEIKPYTRALIDRLFKAIPAGVGSSGSVRLSRDDFREVSERGSSWCVENGYGTQDDLLYTEEGGCVKGADASKTSDRAVTRGIEQVGTLGSGNHYLELQVVRPENIHDRETAQAFGIDRDNQVVIMIHCGSRGFGHQVATDYLKLFVSTMQRYHIVSPDRELACAPFMSKEGQDYFAAMKCAINMSYVNRQVIMHQVRNVFSDILHKSPEEMGMDLVYDVAHNTAMLERHQIGGEEKELLIHRKGATRALGPGSPGLPAKYRPYGQPVILGGSMETGSYLLAGMKSAEHTFFTTAHGSGRTMSRNKAKKIWNGRELQRTLEERGIYIRAVSYSALAEEAGGAYKNIDDVVRATERAGITRRVVRFIPIGNIKG